MRKARLGLCVAAWLAVELLAAGGSAEAQGFPPAHPSEIQVRRAADTTVVFGLVRDAETAGALHGVAVYSVPTDSHGGGGAITDARGWFRLSMVGAPSVQIRVQIVGYETRELAVQEQSASQPFYMIPNFKGICDYVRGPGGRPDIGTSTDSRITIDVRDLQTGGLIEEPVQVTVSGLEPVSGDVHLEATPPDRVDIPIRVPGIYTLRVDADGYDAAKVGPFIIPTPQCELDGLDRYHQHLWLRPN